MENVITNDDNQADNGSQQYSQKFDYDNHLSTLLSNGYNNYNDAYAPQTALKTIYKVSSAIEYEDFLNKTCLYKGRKIVSISAVEEFIDLLPQIFLHEMNINTSFE